ncbi:MAG TPA: phage minor tail protein L [Allosphingosinicella sp.]|jgi:lambda family phage minor tail protein L
MNELITADVQKLEPGALVTLFELDASEWNGGVLRFHGMFNGPVFFKGLEFFPFPVEAEGFERTSSQQPVPVLRVGNVNGAISTLCQMYGDLLGAKFTRRRTFARYLDGQPDANTQAEFTPDIYFVDRKANEDNVMVAFELASVLDFEGQQLPGRQVLADYCPFTYRGEGCMYAGPPVAKADNTPTSDPALDRCGKRLSSCELRIWPDDIKNFGGAPAAGLAR